MRSRLMITAAVVAVVAPQIAGAAIAATGQASPDDINYLANMQSTNRPYFEHFVVGVVQFSGAGVVDSNTGVGVNPEVVVVVSQFEPARRNVISISIG